MNKAALLVIKSLKVTVGGNHGEAFGMLTEAEQNGSLLSGFLDDEHSVFCCESQKIYLKQIICLRHFEPIQDTDDPGLTESGRSQAKRAAFFVEKNFKDFEIFTSPLKRCVETGLALAPNINVRNYLNDISEKEEITTFQKRVSNVLENLPEKSIVVSHCNFIQTLLELMTGQVIPKVHYGEMTNININQILWTKHEFYSDDRPNNCCETL